MRALPCPSTDNISPQQRLHGGAAHAVGRLQNIRVQGGQAHVGVANHGHDAVDGQGDHRRLIADAGEGDQDAQQGDGGNGVQHVAQPHHGGGQLLVLGDEDSQQQADGPGQQDGLARQEEVVPQQAQKPVAALPIEGENRTNQLHHGGHGCSRSAALTGPMARGVPGVTIDVPPSPAAVFACRSRLVYFLAISFIIGTSDVWVDHASPFSGTSIAQNPAAIKYAHYCGIGTWR